MGHAGRLGDAFRGEGEGHREEGVEPEKERCF